MSDERTFTRYCRRCCRQTVGVEYDGPRTKDPVEGHCAECGSSSWATGRRMNLRVKGRPVEYTRTPPQVAGQLDMLDELAGGSDDE